MRRSLFAALLFALASSVVTAGAQTTTPPTDSALVRRIKSDVTDSLALNPKLNLRSKRAMARIVARGDSITRNAVDTVRRIDTVYVTKPDSSVIVKPDTTTPKPPAPVDTAKFDGVAELPRNIPSPPSVACTTIVRVLPGTDLQAAINAAVPGVCLLLKPGSTFIGNFTLPAKSATSAASPWVTIQTDTVLPAPGTRITPALAASLRLAKILSPNYTEAIGTAPSAHHYLIRGLEVGTTPAVQQTTMNVLLRFTDQSAQWSPAGIPNNLWLAQVYAHGTPTLDMRRLQRADYRIGGTVDSYFADAHSNNSDSQCYLVISGQVQRYQNNYCEGGHEPFMSGGGDPPDSTLQPHDIALLGNHFYRPPAWQGVWQAKNLIETKNVRRLLVEGNVIENSWADAQAGFCFVMKGENQDGTAPWSTTADVTIRYNRIRNCANGFNISGRGTNANEVRHPSSRFSIHDNVVDSIGKHGGEGIAMQSLNDINDEQYVHNTFLNGLQGYGSTMALSFDGSAGVRLVWDGNIMGHGDYGVKGSGTSDGATTLARYAPGVLFTRNAIVRGDCTQYPAGNVCPTLVPTSTVTLGADMAKVALYTAGVVLTGTRALRRAAPRRGQLKYGVPVTLKECQKANPKGVVCAEPPMRLR